jgi:hypothetical protein
MAELATATRLESRRCSCLPQGFETEVDVVKSATQREKMKGTKKLTLRVRHAIQALHCHYYAKHRFLHFHSRI